VKNKPKWDELSRIPVKNFYATEEDKTKENWFLYELSNTIFDELTYDKIVSKKYSNQKLLKLSLNLSKYAKKIIEDLLNKGRKPKINAKDIRQKLAKNPQLSYEKRVIKIVVTTVNSFIPACLHCPTKCIYDWKGKCYMFDRGPY